MKSNILKILLISWSVQLSYHANAQIIFPNGHEKKLATALTYIYDETDIPFIYPGGRVTDLKWMHLSDSFPQEWTVVACMNGTCIPGVPQNGDFQNILNNPDSIGFVKFHFSFNGKSGQGIIRYIVFRDFIFSNPDTVVFDITYNPALSGKAVAKSNGYSIFPNHLVDNKINIEIKDSELPLNMQILIFNSIGQTVAQYMITPKSNLIEIDLPVISKGVYSMKIQTDNSQFVSTLLKE